MYSCHSCIFPKGSFLAIKFLVCPNLYWANYIHITMNFNLNFSDKLCVLLISEPKIVYMKFSQSSLFIETREHFFAIKSGFEKVLLQHMIFLCIEYQKKSTVHWCCCDQNSILHCWDVNKLLVVLLKKKRPMLLVCCSNIFLDMYFV